MSKYELEITILPEDVDKRQTLASRIEFTLATSGCRITAGEYDVVITRKSAAQLRKETPKQCPGCGRWSCDRPNCGGSAIAPSCRLAPGLNARCEMHDASCDWSSELRNWKGPTGWVCPESGKVCAEAVAEAVADDT